MEKMEEEISEIKGDVKVIRQNIDTLLSFNTDHETRLRVQEQSQCPFHEKVEKRLDNLDVDSAVTDTKIAFIAGVSSLLGAGTIAFFAFIGKLLLF